MTPYKRQPRRPFTDQMMNPYFQTSHYKENHKSKIEEFVYKAIVKVLKILKIKK